MSVMAFSLGLTPRYVVAQALVLGGVTTVIPTSPTPDPLVGYGLAGFTPSPLYVQPNAPTSGVPFLWVQTGLNADKKGVTLWASF